MLRRSNSYGVWRPMAPESGPLPREPTTMMRDPRIRELFHSTKPPTRRLKFPVFLNRRQDRRRQNLVQMTNVSVHYDNRIILSGVNWTVRRGESWALVGPNGSGKSTLLS